MGQGRAGKAKRRQILPDRFSQIMALFLAFYVLFLISPAIDLAFRERNGFELSGWTSILVIVLGVLCVAVNLGTRSRKYWIIPKMGLMVSFVFASEGVVVRTISLMRALQDPVRSGILSDNVFGYGMAFYSVGLAFFFVFLFLEPAPTPEDQVASGDQNGARGLGNSLGNEDRR